MSKRFQLVGIGNAMVDVLGHADDAFLAENGVEKGNGLIHPTLFLHCCAYSLSFKRTSFPDSTRGRTSHPGGYGPMPN